MDINKKVWFLWHVYKHDGVEDKKLIGVYSTRALAQDAKKRMLTKPGFKERPRGFQIGPQIVDKDYWKAGFITVRF
jgi:hypothetical protein